ncbi:MAG: DUF2971 domain-containing protein [Bacteroidales bacterium]|nr:DUF2971 domain-containing protein [Bacteroidales bacterium]
MEDQKRIVELLNSDDTIYHYCKLHTAIDYILYNQQLKLSVRDNSNDPIENTKPYFNTIADGFYEWLSRNYEKEDKFEEFVTNKFKTTKQICFCMNDFKNYNEMLDMQPLDYYGFLKPRMWDQYADHYQGVCLIFSLKELKTNTNLLSEPINYVDYKTLQRSNCIDKDLTKLNKQDIEKYCELYFKEKILPILFRKHKDYAGENEYRFISTQENECEYIDIKKSLKGVVVSQNLTNEYSLNALEKYAKNLDIEILRVNWQHDGLGIITGKKFFLV